MHSEISRFDADGCYPLNISSLVQLSARDNGEISTTFTKITGELNEMSDVDWHDERRGISGLRRKSNAKSERSNRSAVYP